MPNQLRLSFDDFDGDMKTTSIAVRTEAYSTQAAKLDALADALRALAIGRDHSEAHVRSISDNGPGRATSPVAQGKTSLVLEVQDTVTGVVYREKLPMPNLTLGDDLSGDPHWIATGQGNNSLTVLNPAVGSFATLKTAYDAVGTSPEGNNTEFLRAYVEE